MSKKEETLKLNLDFSKLEKVGLLKQNVLPCVVQHAETLEVLNIAYVNREALEYTLREGVAAFWSTSRNELWVKGKTSGDFLQVRDVRTNCEQNSLVYLVIPKTGAQCHTGRPSCYYRRLKNMQDMEFADE
jgi:phosphoribosyl-AMP cyclohydrolase